MPPIIPTSDETATVSSPQALEDPGVGPVLRLVADVEAGVVEVAGVRVLHREFADADQSPARPRLVAELRLEVIELEGQLPVGTHDAAQQVGDDLLVCHREHHVPTCAVLEARHLGSDGVVAARLAPDIGRMDHRHQQLLAADRVLFLADDLLDPLGDPEAQRQQAVDPRAQLPDVAGPQEQAVRRHLGFGGVVAEAGKEQMAEAHGREGYRRTPAGPRYRAASVARRNT